MSTFAGSPRYNGLWEWAAVNQLKKQNNNSWSSVSVETSLKTGKMWLPVSGYESYAN